MSSTQSLLTTEASNLLMPMDSSTFKIYPRGYVISFLVFTSLSITLFNWNQYTSNAEAMKTFYHQGDTLIGLTNSVFSLTYVFMLYPVTKFITNFGLKNTFVAGGFLNALSACIKCLGTDPKLFYLVLLGQTLGAVAEVFLYSAAATVAGTWFPVSQAARVSTMIFSGSFVGSASAFLVEGAFFNKDSDTATSLNQISISLAIISVVVFLAIIFTFKDKPPTPPSKVQMVKESLASEINVPSHLMSRDYLLYITCQSLVSNTLTVATLVLNSVILQLFQDGQTIVAVSGILMTISGIFSSPLYGFILDSTKQFKTFTIVTYILCFFGTIGLVGSLWIRYSALVYLASIIFGFLIGGFTSVAPDVIIELTYPAPEAVTFGIYNIFSNVCSVILTVVCSNLISVTGPSAVLITLLVVLLIGFPFLLSMKWDLKRQKMETFDRFNESTADYQSR